MATLAEVINVKRQSGQSRTSSLVGSLKDKLKEKIDPRQLFNQTGVLTALFPKLKSFKAGSISPSPPNQNVTELGSSIKSASIKRIEKNTQIFAKNTLSFRTLAANTMLMRKDISNLLKVNKIKPTQKADDYYSRSSDLEKEYESKFQSSSDSKVRPVSTKQRKSSGLLGVLGIVGGLGVAYLIVDFFRNKEQSILSDLKEGLGPIISDFSSNLKTFIQVSIDDFDKNFESLKERMSKHNDKFSEDFGKIFSFEVLENYFLKDISPSDSFINSVDKFKTSIVEELSNFSIIPSAQAATLPSSFPTQTRPGAARTVTGPEQPPSSPSPVSKTYGNATGTSYSDIIGKYEGAGKYDTVFGKAGGAKINGKLVTENTVGEVIAWQNRMRHTNRHAVGKYGFIDVADEAKKSGISYNVMFDAETQEKMQQTFTRVNAKSLSRFGIEPTVENLSLAHTVGPGGAIALLTAQKSGKGNFQAADILHAAHGNMPRDSSGGNNTPARKTNPHLLESVNQVIEKNRKRFEGKSIPPAVTPPVNVSSSNPVTGIQLENLSASMSMDTLSVATNTVIVPTERIVHISSPAQNTNNAKLPVDPTSRLVYQATQLT
jgi:hypothetical protein